MTGGRRNLALVGTHRDYLADMLDDRTGEGPSTVTGCASAEDAAVSYFRDAFENSGGMLRRAVVAVWDATSGQDGMRTFDLEARLSPCAAPDAEPGELDVAIVAKERS